MNVKNNLLRTINKPWLHYAILSSVVIFLAIPMLDANYGSGLDEPLPWIYNYLFANDQLQLSHIIFPHGPLAFLLYPTPFNNNLGLALVVYALLFFLAAFNFFRCYNYYERSNAYVVPFVIAVFIFSIIDLQLCLLLLLVSSVLLYEQKKGKIDLAIFILICAFSFYLKAYIGVLAVGVCIGYCLYLLKDRWKLSVTIGVLIPVIYLLFWLLLFHSFDNFWNHILGVLQLSSDNSSAVSIYVQNDWLLIGFMLAAYLLLPFLLKNREERLLFYLLLLPTFAAWKHGIARQDSSHGCGLFLYLICYVCLYVLYLKRIQLQHFLLLLIIPLACFANLRNYTAYADFNVRLIRMDYWFDIIGNHKQYKQYHLDISSRDVAHLRLDTLWQQKIGNATVDVYPWNYAYIPANNFNFQSRVVLHSYAAYTHWLDKKNSEHYKSDKAPEYILWHTSYYNKEDSSSSLQGIDTRYLLNDEPQTIQTILEYYKIIGQNQGVFIFKKRKAPQLFRTENHKKDRLTINQWIDVPEHSNAIVRLKLQLGLSVKGRAKSFLYKDQAYLLSLVLSNGDTVHHRFVPKNAQDGLWINPYFTDIDKAPYVVKKLAITCNDASLLQSKIIMEWDKLKIDTSFNSASLFSY